MKHTINYDKLLTKQTFHTILRQVGITNYSLTIAIETLKSQLTSKKYYIAVFYFTLAFLVDIFTASSQLIIEKTNEFAIYKAQLKFYNRFNDWWFSTLGILIILILSADVISGEVEKDTLHALFAKPITDSEIIIGKHLGTTFAFSIIITPLIIATYYLEAYIFGASTKILEKTIDEMIYYIIVAILTIAALVALTIFFSSMTSKTIQTALLSFTFVIGAPFIGLIFGLSSTFIEKTNITYYSIGALKPALFNLEFKNYSWHWYYYLLTIIGLQLLFLVLSIIALSRKELP